MKLLALLAGSLVLQSAPAPSPNQTPPAARVPQPTGQAQLDAHERAAMMGEMTAFFNSEIASAKTEITAKAKPGPAATVTCWTCHRGFDIPERQIPAPNSPEQEYAVAAVNLSAGQANQPAETVFKNIRNFKGMKAERIPLVMAMFSRSLGVQCTHCHVKGDFSSEEKPQKEMARRMLRMVSASARQFYKGPTPVGCMQCHRGQVKPQGAPIPRP